MGPHMVHDQFVALEDALWREHEGSWFGIAHEFPKSEDFSSTLFFTCLSDSPYNADGAMCVHRNPHFKRAS